MNRPDDSTPTASNDEALRADLTDAPAADDAVANGAIADDADSYQDHFLHEDEPESEFVAHVAEAPAVDPPHDGASGPPDPQVVRLASSDALTAALVGGGAVITQDIAPIQLPDADTAIHRNAYTELVEPIVATQTFPPQTYVNVASDDAAGMIDESFDSSVQRGDEVPGVEDDSEIESEPIAETEDRDDADTPIETYADLDPEPAAGYVEAEPYPFEQIQDADDLESAEPTTGGGWTIPLMCLGIAIIAFCLVIPQADSNRRLAYERASLRADLESIQAQVATNDEFLRRLAGDATLAERLAQRQLNLQRAGTKALPIGSRDNSSSPFDLVKVAPPPVREPYEPVGGKLAAVCRDTRSRLYLMGGGLFVLGVGLIFGAASPRR